MKIDSSTVGMESARTYRAYKASYRRFSITEYRGDAFNLEKGLNSGDGLASEGKLNSGKELQKENTDKITKDKYYSLEELQNGLFMRSGRVNLRNASTDNVVEDLRQVTIRYIFDLLFANRRHRLKEWMEKQGADNLGADNLGADNQGADNLNIQQVSGILPTAGMVQYSDETYTFTREDTSFSTVGRVRTADGREIQFNVNVEMSRTFEQTFRQDLQLAPVAMCDPLVINLDTDVASLSDQKFYFDIDADGEVDEISELVQGSGYLALDKNNDGVINDGSELFGTKSGDGFADLSAYDEDGNGWIDENDAVWSKLKIWCKDENGKDVLYRLQDKGVGAICLQRASTDFTMMGSNGNPNGAIRSTGVFLYENGNVGTVQHVDVAKIEKGA